MVCANDYLGMTDNEIIQRAIENRQEDGIVVIPPRVNVEEPERDYWLLDEAILLPENTTIVLRNCTIKLSDKCRDNFFRSANCGMGMGDPEKLRNIHIRGEGMCTLLGADHPRASGDGGKILACPCPYEVDDLCRLADWIPEERKQSRKLTFLERHDHSYGTDALVQGESHFGDWRGIGILLANVENFSISGVKIVESHGWGISLEACAYGRVEKIEFDACMYKEIDGMRMNMENQDGVDIRNGCHDIIITDIMGRTGDDVVALTAIAGTEPYEGGGLCHTHVMHSDWSRRESGIHDIVIRNVAAHSHLCWSVRLLPCNTKIWNVVIDGVIDTAPEGLEHGGALLLGEGDMAYGRNLPDGLTNITVNNVISRGTHAITVHGYLKDSVISNVIHQGSGALMQADRENGLVNVKTCNLIEKNV